MLALERAGRLLTAGEVVIARRISRLEGPAARVYARLTARKPEAFALDELQLLELEAALPDLISAELVDYLVPWCRRAELLPLRRLRPAARALGLRSTGRKAELVARLAPHAHWTSARFLRIRHKGLLERLVRWALLSTRKDRSTLVVERLGHIRWPPYRITGGAMVHEDRKSLLAWEALLHSADVDEVLDALDRGAHRAPAGLDLGRRLISAVFDAARDVERSGDPQRALALYERLVPHVRTGHLAVRRARSLEACGQREGALEVLRQARTGCGPVLRLAVNRAGRRIARGSWAPDPPLHSPPVRDVQLAPGGSLGSRPQWRVGNEVQTVEAACLTALEEVGRQGLFAEGALWTTLFALLLVDTAYFLPVPGTLPVPRLSGPVDLGTPAFYARRTDAIDAVLAAVRAGEGPDRVAAAWDRHHGERISGAHWGLADRQLWIEVARGTGPGLASILRALLERGWRASRGLPDLVILPGTEASWPRAFPSKLPGSLILAEVKGPGDALRDEQRVWHHILAKSAVPVEIWRVKPTP